MQKIKFQKSALSFHLMLLIPVVFVIIFSYVPMSGLIIAFKNYKPGLGILGSEWVGFDNFKYVISLPNFSQVMYNTLFIAVLKIIANIIVPVTFALMLNEIRLKWFKKTIQTITYLPYFLSWVVLGGILVDFLAPGGGFINSLLVQFGFSEIYFLGNKDFFPYTIVITDVWKVFGFNTIIYLAALTGIDPTLYEASAVDGANRIRQTLHITLPGIAMFIALMTILGIGGILNAGFDQIFNLYSPAVYKTGDIIDTFVYRLGMQQQQYSVSTAVGFFKSFVSMILIAVSYKLAGKYAGYRVF